MTLAHLLTAIACLLVLAGLFTIINLLRKSKFMYHIKKRTLYRRLHSLEDIEKIKEYAELFSLDSSALDIDTHEILLLGQKLEEDLGASKVRRLVRRVYLHRDFKRFTIYKTSCQSISHRVTSLIRKLKLITRHTEIHNTLFVGGENRGEDDYIIL